ncbi:hypothetical protein D1B31_02880 [Neobacillus notoginsengisoli]|uniref:Uncharacterized protein n=1 Tax=Neobacillus notoginsengisoli TaxID=1578198 RepID=A0A417YYE8_9BACI|nr:hypothetical protein [Neobacillus notoginsengisoli]RHW42560.1 hypothetical protein D1B31_02880 [Neobacillus notoginsengisoli]
MKFDKTFILLCVIFFSFGLAVNATSWVRLSPQEVADRAEIVIVGKYDFSGEPVKGEPPLNNGYNFIVQKAYKGDDIKATMLVGIDMFDVSWAKEFQQQGGSFLLFLEEGKQEYLVPVGGPNGMIQLKNGNVYSEDSERLKFFGDYLKTQELTGTTIPVKPVKLEEKKVVTGIGPYLLPIVFILLAGTVAFAGIKRAKSKTNQNIK